ncbi:hypothetical protein HYY71_06230 [Candidatus Woesearchaeota archaeon]|nr:hypothetical protein [Candidatus Woesearchaeota archaeon]
MGISYRTLMTGMLIGALAVVGAQQITIPGSVSTSSSVGTKCTPERVRKSLESEETRKGRVRMSFWPEKQAGIEAVISADTNHAFSYNGCKPPTAVLYQDGVPIGSMNLRDGTETSSVYAKSVRVDGQGQHTYHVEVTHPYGIVKKSEPKQLYFTGQVKDTPPNVQLEIIGNRLKLIHAPTFGAHDYVVTVIDYGGNKVTKEKKLVAYLEATRLLEVSK